MKEIVIRNRKYKTEQICLVDDEDYPSLVQYSWHIVGDGYVARCARRKDGEQTARVYMHRQILNPPPDVMVDHANGNKLDNRRANIRLCNRGQNAANHTIKMVAGLRWDASCQAWNVRVAGESKGYFDDKNAAINCYNHHAQLRFGEFASIKPCRFMDVHEWLTHKREKPSTRGYCLDKRSGRWMAYITRTDQKQRSRFLGLFDTETEAAQAYQRAKAQQNSTLCTTLFS